MLSQLKITNIHTDFDAYMATNKTKTTKQKTATKKQVLKKTVVAKKKTADQILKSIKRKTTVAQKKIKSTAVVEAKPIQLNKEHEARVAEWRAQELAK